MAFRTQAQVDKLRLPAGKAEHWEFDQDTTGLSIRLQGRARSWIVWYAVAGKRRKMKIGDVSGLKLEAARRKATDIVNAGKDGQDPLAEREATKAKAADTLKALIDIYLVRRAKPRQKTRSYAETKRNLEITWQPMHHHLVDAVTSPMVAAQLERIGRERGPTAAKNALVYLSGCYSWAVRRGLATHNPTIAVEPPAVPTSKARALKPAELAEVWRACGDDDFGRLVRLLLLLGVRRDEAAEMRWSEIDLERRLWTIPGHRVSLADRSACTVEPHLCRSKNHLPCEVPLFDQALALLPDRRDGRDLVFGRGRGGFSGFSNCKERLDRRIACRRAEQRLGRPLKKGEQPKPDDRIAPWRLHDLRHTFSTMAHEIGVEPHIVEACLNHISGHKASVAGRYNAAQYREQKRAALQRYADWLDQVISGEPATNVVPMRA